MSKTLIELVGHGIITFVIFVYENKPKLVLWCHTNEDCHDRLDKLVEELFETGYIQDWPDTITMVSALIKEKDKIEILDECYACVRWKKGKVWVTSYILPKGVKSIKELSPEKRINVPIADVRHDGFNFVDVTEDDRIGIDMYLRYWWPTWRNLKGVLS